MSIIEYLKERFLFLVINLIIFIMLCVVLFMINTSVNIVLLIFCIWFFPLIAYIITEFVKSKKFYDELEDTVDNLERKYLVTAIIKKPEFLEGKILFDVLRRANKDMHENVNIYRDMQSGYREYIETWVHEIKTPIASTRLIIDNNENKITKNIEYEMKKVENYIDQILYYSKSNDAYKDYIIKKISLIAIVRNVIKNNSKDFINKKISVDIDNADGIVYSDAKWLEFIINQIIGNSVKYCNKNGGKITIYSITNVNNIVLNIEDNGIGIVDYDLSRVFEKGFTGENGRQFGKSTGIGLYLCNKLCGKLGLRLILISKERQGTKVSIIFPIGNVSSII
ncbi:sensor histidine kinase [Clostridium sp.]